MFKSFFMTLSDSIGKVSKSGSKKSRGTLSVRIVESGFNQSRYRSICNGHKKNMYRFSDTSKFGRSGMSLYQIKAILDKVL